MRAFSPGTGAGMFGEDYASAGDGTRLLINRRVGEARGSIDVLVNWPHTVASTP